MKTGECYCVWSKSDKSDQNSKGRWKHLGHAGGRGNEIMVDKDNRLQVKEEEGGGG